MNRRGFFKTLAGVVALSAGGIALIEPEKTIFLPPRGGWLPTLKMREVQQYLINTDTMPMRWDMAWMTREGDFQQHFVCVEPPQDPYRAYPSQEWLEFQRSEARRMLAAKVPLGARMILPKLPRSDLGGFLPAGYV